MYYTKIMLFYFLLLGVQVSSALSDIYSTKSAITTASTSLHRPFRDSKILHGIEYVSNVSHNTGLYKPNVEQKEKVKEQLLLRRQQQQQQKEKQQHQNSTATAINSSSSSPIYIPGRPFVFTHISHGGGTFWCSLAKANGMDTVCMYKLWHARRPLNLLSCKNINELMIKSKKGGNSMLGFEKPFDDSDWCPEYFRYILFMRHPMDVITSIVGDRIYNMGGAWGPLEMYNHGKIRGRRQPGLFEAEFLPAKNDPNLNKSYRDDRHGWGLLRLDNIFIRTIVARTSVFRAPIGTIGLKELELAKAKLNTYDLVFTFDDMNNSTKQVDALIRSKIPTWSGNVSIKEPSNSTVDQKRNSHASDKQKARLPVDEMEKLAEYNRFDIELYEYAKELFRISFENYSNLRYGE